MGGQYSRLLLGLLPDCETSRPTLKWKQKKAKILNHLLIGLPKVFLKSKESLQLTSIESLPRNPLALLMYPSSSSAALQDISMTILPGQNVGICGRTGRYFLPAPVQLNHLNKNLTKPRSGKSTLFSVLLRLLDLSSGTIKIDSLDLSTLHRTSIRRHLTAIPQDPLHLIGTVRLNIDPFSIATDSEIIAALERVGLWSILSSRGGLTAEIVPDSLSKGQQQLLALARALLHKSKIVLLDEATSSVDKETEETLRKVMKEDFSDCTIISIAHRLETIMDYDVVAVMNKGRMVEFGRPAELMADEKSAFSLLWKGAGDVSLE